MLVEVTPDEFKLLEAMRKVPYGELRTILEIPVTIHIQDGHGIRIEVIKESIKP